MFSKLWAFLTRQEVVYLVDFDGESTKTFAFKTKTHLLATRCHTHKKRIVILKPDGSVESLECTKYVKRWFK